MRNIRGLLLLDKILLWTGMFPFKFHLKYLLVWNSWFFSEFLLHICLKMKDVKENPVQWTEWDSNGECLKFEFDKVGKHSSSTKIITIRQGRQQK